MHPRRPSNFPKEFPKEGEDARKTEQKRRGTLAQLLLGDKQTGKNNSEEGQSESGRSTFHFVSPKDKRQPRSTSRRSGATESVELMKPKILHVMVIGPKDVGKTTFLRTLAFGHIPTTSTNNTPLISPLLEQQQNYSPTREDDTYHIQMHYFINPLPNSSTDGNIKQTPIELILFHDTVGIPPFGNIEIKRAHLQVADAFLLVYSVTDLDSFNRVDAIKKQLEREKFGGKEKRGENVQIIVLGTKCDLIGRRRVDSQFALNWANQEKGEPKFSLSRKLRPEKSNAQIVMDF
uniref:G domain-containing protein n=1 Tax=Meloidogyne hapla TaxID=6305 RepID=A0A1I8AYZ2_MELHA